MKVFISWSGERSKAVAEALRYWLPKVIQAIEPWMSADDIEKGTRWRSGIADELEQSSVGIICVTRENLDSTWIHFEDGALSKQQQNKFMCTFLFGLAHTDILETVRSQSKRDSQIWLEKGSKPRLMTTVDWSPEDAARLTDFYEDLKQRANRLYPRDKALEILDRLQTDREYARKMLTLLK